MNEPKHIKQAMINMAKGKIDAYKALLKQAELYNDEEETEQLKKLIAEWMDVLRDLTSD